MMLLSENVLILIICAIKNDDEFYPQLLLEEALVAQKVISIDIF